MNKMNEEQKIKEQKEKIITKLKDASAGIVVAADDFVAFNGSRKDIAFGFVKIVNNMGNYYPTKVINELVKFGLDKSNFENANITSNSNCEELKTMTELLNKLQELKDMLSK